MPNATAIQKWRSNQQSTASSQMRLFNNPRKKTKTLIERSTEKGTQIL
jgi:hypothetical protein